jgi:hypothetical protein
MDLYPMKFKATENILNVIQPQAVVFHSHGGAQAHRGAFSCYAACPIETGNGRCLKTCVLENGHSGAHQCPDGHQWF